jgi:hypothetical protein
MGTQVDILTALDAEMALSDSPERFRVVQAAADGDVWKVWLKPDTEAKDAGSLDSSLEGSRAWWPGDSQRMIRQGAADVLAVVPEEDLIVLRYATGPLPAPEGSLWIYPIQYLQKLRELWTNDSFAAQQLTWWDTFVSQNREAPNLRADPSRFPWLRSRQKRSFDLVGWNTSFLFGPPGTGKTTTLGALLAQVLDQFPLQRILLLSTTNSAVDQALLSVDKALEKLTQSERQPSKLRSECRRVGTHFISKNYAGRQHLLPAIDPAQVKRLLELHSSQPEKQDAQAFGQWKAAIEKLQMEIRRNSTDVLSSARLVALTTTGAVFRYEDLAALQDYDLVVFDEGSQVSLVHALTLASLGKRVLFAGDPRQLAPIVRTKDRDAEKWLGESPFQRMREQESYVCKLNEQSRMAEPICNLVSHVFYGGDLVVAHEKASNAEWLDERAPLGIKDYGTRNTYVVPTAAECERKGGVARREETARIAVDIAMKLVGKVPPNEIQVLTPFRAQRSLIQRKLRDAKLSGVRVSTVHRAQGTECDTIIFDPVEAGTAFLNAGELGRRLINVAVSRAKARFFLLVSPENLSNQVIKQLSDIIENSQSLPEAALEIDAAVGMRDFPKCVLGRTIRFVVREGVIVGKVVRTEGEKLVVSNIASGNEIKFELATLRSRPARDQAIRQELQRQLQKLKDENEALRKSLLKPRLNYQVSEKGGLSVYGLGRFPVTLYRGQWLKLLDAAPEVLRFIAQNEKLLTTKEPLLK